MMNSERILFRIFLAVHFIVWTAVGMIRKSIAMDTAEAMIWGREWTFGTNKHPYLSGWVAELFRQGCLGDCHWAAALLASVCTTFGIWFAYRLARRFLGRPRAMISAILLEGCVYYNVCGLEYNCNLLSIALIPAFFWMFHVAISEDRPFSRRVAAWFVTGVVAGLLLMTKYTNGVFLLVAAVYSIMYFRREFLVGAVVAAVPFLLIVLPHVRFLFDTDFAVLAYFLGRSETAASWSGHFLSPLRFFFSQVPVCWAALLLLVATCIRARGLPEVATLPVRNRRFLFLSALGPLVIMTLISAVGAIQMKSMWGSTLVGLIPLLLVSFVPGVGSLGFRSVWLLALPIVLSIAMSVIQALHVSARTYTDYDAFAEVVVREWRQRCPECSIRYVGGYVSYAANLGLLLNSRPQVIDEMNPRQTPWLDDADILRSGAVVVDDRPWSFKRYREMYPALTSPVAYPIELRSYFGKTKKIVLYVGILPPEGT